jgi:CheY-specific phosphatase CheX
MSSVALRIVEDESNASIEAGMLDPNAVFFDVIRECAIALMEGCNLDLVLESQDREEMPHVHHTGYAGLIGFGGTEMRGSIVLYLDESLVRASRPPTIGEAAVQDPALRDWTGELANQLLGRAKNMMLRYEVKIGMGVPTAISGTGYTLTSIGETPPLRMRFSSRAGAMSVLINLRCRPGLQVKPPSPDLEEAAAEGDMMLF